MGVDRTKAEGAHRCGRSEATLDYVMVWRSIRGLQRLRGLKAGLSATLTSTAITIMSANILDPSAVVAALPNVLPSSDKKLKSPHDGIVALVHAVLNLLLFRLIAVDESSPASTTLNGVLPAGWNQHGPGHYTLRYRHEQSSLEFVIKVSKLGSRTVFNAIALEV